MLPNVAMLSDRQCRQISDYVQSGGSLMASFETGLYDENLNRRADSGLAPLFGIHKAGDAIGTNRQRILCTHRSARHRTPIPSLKDSATPTGCPARGIASLSSPSQIRCSQ